MSARTPSMHTATCSLSFYDSVVTCRESLQKDYVSNRLMFRCWKHSWTTWSEKESLHPAHEIIGSQPCTTSSDMLRLKNPPVSLSAKKSFRFPTRAPPDPRSHPLRKSTW